MNLKEPHPYNNPQGICIIEPPLQLIAIFVISFQGGYPAVKYHWIRLTGKAGSAACIKIFTRTAFPNLTEAPEEGNILYRHFPLKHAGFAGPAGSYAAVIPLPLVPGAVVSSDACPFKVCWNVGAISGIPMCDVLLAFSLPIIPVCLLPDRIEMPITNF